MAKMCESISLFSPRLHAWKVIEAQGTTLNELLDFVGCDCGNIVVYGIADCGLGPKLRNAVFGFRCTQWMQHELHVAEPSRDVLCGIDSRQWWEDRGHLHLASSTCIPGKFAEGDSVDGTDDSDSASDASCSGSCAPGRSVSRGSGRSRASSVHSALAVQGQAAQSQLVASFGSLPSPIQSVDHADPPAGISEDEASQFADVQHAGFVDRHTLLAPSLEEIHTPVGSPTQTICVSKINRNTKRLRQELTNGPSLRPCRDGLENEGFAWELRSGALVFVLPWHYRNVMSVVEGMTLLPDHIVFAKDFEYLVEEALQRCSDSLTVCKYLSEVAQVADDVSHVATFGSDVEPTQAYAGDKEESFDLYHLTVERTFICAKFVAPSTSTVAASTTDAHLGKHANPRRAKCDSAFPR